MGFGIIIWTFIYFEYPDPNFATAKWFLKKTKNVNIFQEKSKVHRHKKQLHGDMGLGLCICFGFRSPENNFATAK